MYKGYKVQEIILRDYAIAPETAVIVDAPAGCSRCQEEERVQPGHSLCSIIPDVLVNDENVHPCLDSSQGWILLFNGPNDAVDKWL